MDAPDLQPISAPTAVKIVEAASYLFMQRGYKAVSITDIIKAADVTKPTLYYYFADKEELFVQMGLRVTAAMGERMRAATTTPGGIVERLRAVAEVLMSNRDTDMRMMRHEMFEHLGQAQRSRLSRAFFLHIFSPIVRVMEDGITDGDLTRYPPITLAKMFMGMAESFQEFAPRNVEGQESQHTMMFGDTALNTADLVDLFLHGVSGAARH
ncbi:MAG: TetR/AcrR family transcriptional regulator [Chloroflexales bacterium]|nr:TetR/AcrR family transcriptional regulator [Chloroflexales bacterium]